MRFLNLHGASLCLALFSVTTVGCGDSDSGAGTDAGTDGQARRDAAGDVTFRVPDATVLADGRVIVPDATVVEPPTDVELLASLGNEICAYQARCYGAVGCSVASMQQGEALAEAFEAGEFSVNRAALEACLDALEDGDCRSDAEINAICGAGPVTSPKRQLGDACTVTNACPEGSYCAGATEGCVGTCSRYAKVGEVCGSEEDVLSPFVIETECDPQAAECRSDPNEATVARCFSREADIGEYCGGTPCKAGLECARRGPTENQCVRAGSVGASCTADLDCYGGRCRYDGGFSYCVSTGLVAQRDARCNGALCPTDQACLRTPTEDDDAFVESCQEPLEIGASCQANLGQCGASAYCPEDTRKCAVRKSQGQACDAANVFECTEGLGCIEGKCSAVSSPRAQGQPCSIWIDTLPGAPQCADGLVCEATSLSCLRSDAGRACAGTCVSPAKEGEVCIGDVPCERPNELYCSSGSCKKRVAPGASCSFTYDVNPCALPEVNRCGAESKDAPTACLPYPTKAGDSCDTLRPCPGLLLCAEDYTCKESKGIGEACTNDVECIRADARCIQGTCQPRLAEGASCEEGAFCTGTCADDKCSCGAM